MFPRLAFFLYKTSMASARLGISFFSLQFLSLSQLSGVCDSLQFLVSPQLAALTGKSNSKFCPQELKPLSTGSGVSRTLKHSASSTLRARFLPARISPPPDELSKPGSGPPTSDPRPLPDRVFFAVRRSLSQHGRAHSPYSRAPPLQLPDPPRPRSGWSPCRPPPAPSSRQSRRPWTGGVQGQPKRPSAFRRWLCRGPGAALR